jgi:hypothetical protein
MNIEQFAHRVTGHSEDGPEEVFVDPASIMITIQIITSLVKTIRACRQSKSEVKHIVSKPSGTHMRTLRRVVRRHLGVVGYLKNGRDVMSRIMTQGANLSEKEIDNILMEIK